MKHCLFIEALMFHSTTVKVRTCDKIEYGVYTQNIVSSVHAFTLSFSCLSCVIQANATVRGEYRLDERRHYSQCFGSLFTTVTQLNGMESFLRP